MQHLRKLILKKNQERRIKSGHLWIYSNEVDVEKTPLSLFNPGEMVNIEDSKSKFIGSAYINPHTLLCARLLTNSRSPNFDQALMTQRLHAALLLREQFFKLPFYRWVYGESDFLPGLVIDRYQHYIVVQINTAGMELLKTQILEAILQIVKPRGVLFRNDSRSRAIEGLSSYVELAFGEVPEEIEIVENEAKFNISLWKGQKTGWFFDHRNNRSWVKHFAAGKRVLDLFSYVGSFSITTALGGAKKVVAVDSSELAIQNLERNAKLNDVSNQIITMTSEVIPALKNLNANKEKFDVVLLDPPAFIKKRKDIKSGYQAYWRVNQLAMNLVAEGGFLISSSCSLHCSREMLLEILLQSSNALGRPIQIIQQGHQDLDHPVHPAIPETNYLKTFFCKVW